MVALIRLSPRSLSAALLLLLTLPSLASASTFDVHPGESIQAAINASSNGDTVLVHPGEYIGFAYEEISFLGKAIRVRSLAGPEQTIISGNGWEDMLGYGFRFENGEGPASVLEGFTIRLSERGIFCDGSSPMLLNLIFKYNFQGLWLENWSAPTVFLCKFLDNHAEHPGGCCGSAIRCDRSSPLIGNCLFQYNSSGSQGGAVYATDGSDLHLLNSEFAINSSAVGGAMYIEDSQCSLENVEFNHNGAQTLSQDGYNVIGRGGAIYSRNSSLIFDDVSFQNNTSGHNLAPSPGAGAGGAIYLEGTECLIRGGLLTDNRANGDGTAVYMISGSWLDVDACTIANNNPVFYEGRSIFVESSTLLGSQTIVADTQDGVGIFGADQSAQLILSCMDVHGNELGDYGGSFADPTGSDGNISEDPLFCNATGQDYTLTQGSPCLPSGNECSVLIGYFDVGCDGVTAVPASGPVSAATLQNHPNPFNPSTTILFSIASAAEVEMTIHDASGRLVATLARRERFTAGEHAIQWSGLDDAGLPVPSGQYFCRVEAEGAVRTRKLTLLK